MSNKSDDDREKIRAHVEKVSGEIRSAVNLEGGDAYLEKDVWEMVNVDAYADEWRQLASEEVLDILRGVAKAEPLYAGNFIREILNRWDDEDNWWTDNVFDSDVAREYFD